MRFFGKKKETLEEVGIAPENEAMDNGGILDDNQSEVDLMAEEVDNNGIEDADKESDKSELGLKETKDTDKKVKKGKEPEEIKEYVLYVIMDKHVDGTLEFFRNFGLNVSRIFNNISDARDVLMMQIQPSRIVVVDTGTGRFTSMTSRKELIDLMGISDEENKTTVFYSDSVIKKEIEYAKEVEDKYIEWIKYTSTSMVLATLLQYGVSERYIIDNEYKEVAPVVKTLNCHGVALKDIEKVNIGPVIINTSDIVSKQTEEIDGYEMLEEYVISI